MPSTGTSPCPVMPDGTGDYPEGTCTDINFYNGLMGLVNSAVDRTNIAKVADGGSPIQHLTSPGAGVCADHARWKILYDKLVECVDSTYAWKVMWKDEAGTEQWEEPTTSDLVADYRDCDGFWTDIDEVNACCDERSANPDTFTCQNKRGGFKALAKVAHCLGTGECTDWELGEGEEECPCPICPAGEALYCLKKTEITCPEGYALLEITVSWTSAFSTEICIELFGLIWTHSETKWVCPTSYTKKDCVNIPQFGDDTRAEAAVESWWINTGNARLALQAATGGIASYAAGMNPPGCFFFSEQRGGGAHYSISSFREECQLRGVLDCGCKPDFYNRAPGYGTAVSPNPWTTAIFAILNSGHFFHLAKTIPNSGGQVTFAAGLTIKWGRLAR